MNFCPNCGNPLVTAAAGAHEEESAPEPSQEADVVAVAAIEAVAEVAECAIESMAEVTVAEEETERVEAVTEALETVAEEHSEEVIAEEAGGDEPEPDLEQLEEGEDDHELEPDHAPDEPPAEASPLEPPTDTGPPQADDNKAEEVTWNQPKKKAPATSSRFRARRVSHARR